MEWLEHINNPKPANIFSVHGEPVASYPLADLIGEKIKASTYIPRYGDIAIIEGRNWRVEEADITIEPVAKDLEDFLSLAEAEYIQIKKRILNVVLREPKKLRDVTIRVEKVVRYMKKLMNDI
jgi:metallo-beta-lactamase family protein